MCRKNKINYITYIPLKSSYSEVRCERYNLKDIRIPYVNFLTNQQIKITKIIIENIYYNKISFSYKL